MDFLGEDALVEVNVELCVIGFGAISVIESSDVYHVVKNKVTADDEVKTVAFLVSGGGVGVAFRKKIVKVTAVKELGEGGVGLAKICIKA